MDTDQLQQFYDELSAVYAAGNEEATQAIIQKRFFELPESVQGELLTRLYFETLQQKVEEQETIAAIQQQGISAIETLKSLKKELEGK